MEKKKRSKCYCFSHCKASRFQTFFLSANHGHRKYFSVSHCSSILKSILSALHIINFKDKSYPTNELLFDNKILKICNYIKLSNCLFIKNLLLNNHLPIFEYFLKKTSETYSHSTRHAATNSVLVPQLQTN